MNGRLKSSYGKKGENRWWCTKTENLIKKNKKLKVLITNTVKENTSEKPKQKISKKKKENLSKWEIPKKWEEGRWNTEDRQSWLWKELRESKDNLKLYLEDQQNSDIDFSYQIINIYLT
jgi:hypothetical protein